MQRTPVTLELFADAEHGVRPRQERLEPRAALGEREPAQVLIAIAQDVEENQRDGLLLLDRRHFLGV